jgi:NIMA (never in mitosis gene a)-related kinase
MGQNIYIVMEYCEKGDLCTYMTERQKNKKYNYYFNEDFIWKLFIQISIGLYYIHSKKILHRDIKTLNIFLTKELNGKIGDLGVAKVLEGTNHAITFIGTPYYVSPEMCQNKPYNEKSDIWALGCILYELITFCHPFTASNQAALFIKILHGNYTPLPEKTSKDLVNMVKFILQKNFNKRPSMKDIITSKTFMFHAKRLGLDNDINEVINIQKSSTINSNTLSSINKGINNLKKSQKLKIENKKSSKIFLNENKIDNNRVFRRENGTDRKLEKKILIKILKRNLIQLNYHQIKIIE